MSQAMACADAVARLHRLLRDYGPSDQPDTFGEDASFEALGFDSLDGIAALMAIEEEFDIELPDDALDLEKTFGQLVDLVLGLLQAKA